MTEEGWRMKSNYKNLEKLAADLLQRIVKTLFFLAIISSGTAAAMPMPYLPFTKLELFLHDDNLRLLADFPQEPSEHAVEQLSTLLRTWAEADPALIVSIAIEVTDSKFVVSLVGEGKYSKALSKESKATLKRKSEKRYELMLNATGWKQVAASLKKAYPSLEVQREEDTSNSTQSLVFSEVK